MKQTLRFFVFVLLVICFSCESKKWLVNCGECFENEPLEAIVSIKLRDIQVPVTINIYDGDLEDNVPYDSFQAYGNEFTASTGLNKKFTFTATYNIGGKVYIAVDATVPRVKYEENLCDYPCYYVYDNVVDLRLRNIISGR
ncbi:MAG: hypothetical protein GYA41_02430 [Bacteroidales bacterium]|nr:hypothetical protein [Bacteroidales bacterium]